MEDNKSYNHMQADLNSSFLKNDDPDISPKSGSYNDSDLIIETQIEPSAFKYMFSKESS